MADNYEEDHAHPQHHPHHSHHLHPANVHQRVLPRGPSHANHRSPMEVSVLKRRLLAVGEADFVFVFLPQVSIERQKLLFRPHPG